MDTIKKVYVLVDNETNEFVLTDPDFNGNRQLVISPSHTYLEIYWHKFVYDGKYRIEEIAPLPF